MDEPFYQASLGETVTAVVDLLHGRDHSPLLAFVVRVAFHPLVCKREGEALVNLLEEPDDISLTLLVS